MVICFGEIIPLLNKFLTLCVCRVSKNEIVLNAADEYLLKALPNDDSFQFCCTELLACISSIFSWAPNNESTMTSEFFNNIYELCLFNSNETADIHIAAIMTINEMFYLQKPLPQPQIQANGITELLQQSKLTHSLEEYHRLEEYQDKLTELLKLFLTQQWNRCVNSKDFPTREFLLYLFNFTFSSGISALTFTDRLSVWKPIIQSFNEKAAGRYTETIVQLISNVFKKMQFQYDNELEILDNEELDENMQTELQHFLNQCNEIISTAAEVEPCKIFDLIHSEFNRDDGKLKVFLALLNSLPDFSKEIAKIPNFNLNELLSCYTQEPSKVFFFHCLVHDLSSLIQTITQLSSIVLLMTDERSNSISIVIRTCIYALKLANRKKLHLYNLGNSTMTTELIELQAQLVTSVRSLILLKSEVFEDYEEIFSLIASVSQTLLPPQFDCAEPLIVVNSSAQLMLTITSGIRPSYILKHPFVLELLQSNLSHQQDRHVRLSIKRIIFNILLLPYCKVAISQIEDQEYEKRGSFLQQYVEFTSNTFLSMDLTSENQALFDHIKSELEDYEELLTVYEDTNTISKQMLLSGLQKIISRAIELFQRFAKNPIVYSTIVNFFLSVVRCLQLQLGSDFIIQIIRMFLEMATVSNGNSEAINKLLQMLIFIMQPHHYANILMNDVLKLTLDDLLPFEQIQNADTSVNLFTLFDSILQNHWNYFHKTQPADTAIRNYQEDLMKIFNAYGMFLCNQVNGTNSQDPNVIRIVLASLEKLNHTWHLYDKVLFQTTLLKSFLTTLIRLLISPSGILFYDQLISIIFTMSNKNMAALQESFVSIGYAPDVKIIKQIIESTDLPTFANRMEILRQDTIYSQFLI